MERPSAPRDEAEVRPDDARRARLALWLWLALGATLYGCELWFRWQLPDWPYTRGWNVAHEDSGPFASDAGEDAPGPFFPLVRWQGTCSGDLAVLTNVPALRRPRQQTFTTDGYGYRNAPGMEQGPWHVVAFGDSMTAGSGIADDETFPRRLAERLDAPVYNAGGKDASTVLAEARFARTPPRFVLLQSVERFLSYDDAMQRLAELEPGTRTLPSPARTTPPSRARARWSRAYSAATHYGEALWASLQLRLFGELTTDACVLAEDGLTLFARDDLLHLAVPPRFRGVDEIADAMAHAHAAWAARGSTLVFLAAPSKGNVLRELVPADYARLMQPGALLDALHAALDARGVPYVDLQRALRDAHVRDPETLLYWPDDTHWTPAGADLAAAAIAARLETLEKLPR